MPTILSLSSQVARGHVGHSAAIFAWQRLGIEVVALPTILLSNRPDYPHRAGERIRPEFLSEMVAALDANGWLGEIDAVFTGYLPSAAHVALAAGLVDRLKAAKPDLLYCCDPILGDEPGGLYIAEDAANAMRDTLLPLADVVTPNRFELGWLAGEGVLSAADAVRAARRLTRPMVLATSAPGDSTDELTNLLVEGGKAWGAVVGRRAGRAAWHRRSGRGAVLRPSAALASGARSAGAGDSRDRGGDRRERGPRGVEPHRQPGKLGGARAVAGHAARSR